MFCNFKNNMKRFLTLFSAVFIISCSKTVNDTEDVCTSDCTTISGKFVTLNNAPVPGISVSLSYHISGGELGGGYTRKIVNTRAGADGIFSKSFYLKDNELGDSARGYFIIDVDDRKIDANKYIRLDNNPLGFAIYSIGRRDTVINNIFYIPTKAFIKVHLNNFISQQAGDFFEVQSLFPYGADIANNPFLDSPYSTGSSGYDTFKASQPNNLFTVFVAEGEKNIIRISKRKNGENSYQDYPVFVPGNNTIELSYNY
jgi:hypothetical protein